MSNSLLSMPKQASSPLLPRLHIDLPLLTGIILLCSFGLAMLYSASGSDMAMVKRQLVSISLAFAVMFTIAQFSPAKLLSISPWFYLAGLLLLVAVLVMGDMGKGAQRAVCLFGHRSGRVRRHCLIVRAAIPLPPVSPKAPLLHRLPPHSHR